MMQFENPIPQPYSGSGTVMTSTATYTNHQPTPFYIDNILASTTSGNDENDSSATTGAIGVSNETEQGSMVGITNASPNPGMLVHHNEGVISTNLQGQGSPNNGQNTGLRPINSPYHPILSATDTSGGNVFLTSGSSSLQNGTSPVRHNQITRPIVPTPVQAVPTHHPGMLSYPNSGPYSRPNIYDQPIQGPYSQPPIQYSSGPYPVHSAHPGQRLDTYSYPVRHDYSWFLERQAAYNKGELWIKIK